MEWNRDTFNNNIQWLIDTFCDGKAIKFNAVIGQRDAATKWKRTDLKPSLGTLLTISEKFNISLDWLLTGQGPKEAHTGDTEEVDETMAGWPEETRNACRQVKEVFDSGHPNIKAALLFNIEASLNTVKQKEEMKKEMEGLKKKMQHLENLRKKDKGAGTEEAAPSNTGKKAM
jgi:hypothetical protein